MVKQISVFVENQKGRLSNITGILKEEQVNIKALSIADTSDFGILRLIVDQPDKAYQALKANGRTASITDVLAVGFPDTPGSMGHTVQLLSDAGIAIEYVYAFGLKGDDKAYGVFKTSDPQRTQEVLRENGIVLLDGETLYSL
ncbi:MAG: ACT domain-containing protein [Eubacteriales bacterium]|jgi:hypothetical protein